MCTVERKRARHLPLEIRAAAAAAFALALAAAATAAADTVGVGFFDWTRAVALFTSTLRPSTIVPFSCSRARSASTLEANVTKPKPCKRRLLLVKFTVNHNIFEIDNREKPLEELSQLGTPMGVLRATWRKWVAAVLCSCVGWQYRGIILATKVPGKWPIDQGAHYSD